MYCSKCGTKNSGRGLFCKQCGASLVDEVLEEQEETEKPYKYYQEENITRNKTTNKTSNKSTTKNNGNSKKDKHNSNSRNNSNSVETKIVHKTSTFQKIMIFLLILIIMVLAGALIALGLYIFQDKTVEVPNVLGTDIEQATIVLENSDLRVKVKEKEVDDEKSNNIVLDQSKESGEFVAKNTKIVLTVGVYNEQTVENFVGLSQEDAIKKINKLGLDYEIKETYSTEKAGTVISQTPTYGTTYDDDTKIILTISKEIEDQQDEIETEKSLPEE